jgi:benzoyl-CoA-dihydrodiol lyase
MGVTAANAGPYPMANGLSRLATRFLGAPERADAVLARAGDLFDAEASDELGLASVAPDGIDWTTSCASRSRSARASPPTD